MSWIQKKKKRGEERRRIEILALDIDSSDIVVFFCKQQPVSQPASQPAGGGGGKEGGRDSLFYSISRENIPQALSAKIRGEAGSGALYSIYHSEEDEFTNYPFSDQNFAQKKD